MDSDVSVGKEQSCSLSLYQLKGRLDYLRRLPVRIAEYYLRPVLLKWSIQHLSGPQTIEYGQDEVLVFCVVRNGAAHVRSFIQHHFELGVRHIVFLDNDSTDDTVAIAQEYDNVTILRTNCPYRKYENVMKRYLARRFSQGKWALCVDIDELFDYPFSEVLNLPSLIAYLNQHSYTAVVAQMLDMFPDTTLSGLQTITVDDGLKQSYPYYDISNIRKLEYVWGVLSNPAVKRYHGGIRDTLFGTDNGLTKVALFFVDESIELFVKWHHMDNVKIADFTTVLLHYPFVTSFYQKVSEAVETRRYGHHTIQYTHYWEGLRQNLELQIKRNTARKLNTLEELLDSSFLVASPTFMQWVNENTGDIGGAAAALISVCIVCRNEADKLPLCLESVVWADEVLVMDLSSEDESAAVAKAYGAQVITREPFPIVEPLRNELAAAARGEWILALDPDERVTPGLARELQQLAQRTDLDAIVIPRMNWDLGYPPSNPIQRYEPQLRMYRPSKVKWPTIPNKLPIVPPERKYHLPTNDELVIIHDRSRNIPEVLERSIRYAPAQAQSMIDQGQVFTAKNMLVALAAQTDKEFFRGEAWKDGVPGILRASILVAFKFYVWAAFWQLSGAQRTAEDDRFVRRLGTVLGFARKLLNICTKLYYITRRVII